MINDHMFREYDIRGVAGKDLTVEMIEKLGRVVVAHAREKRGGNETLTVAVGRDGRLSSPELSQALVAGLVAAGASVVDTGLGPSPALYFAVHHHAADVGIMLTGSHNPPEYNGLKMTIAGKPVYGAEIQSLKERLLAGDFSGQAGGSVRQVSVLEPYLERMTRDYRPGRPLHVILDCGNGVAGVVVPELVKRLPNVKAEVLFPEVDGTFPNHHPDPTVEENLLHLRARMAETGAELGIAFDGDADRIGALDEHGQVVWGDRLMILFARGILAERPGATVIGDVKCSQLLFDAVAAAGGNPLMWKTGHSLIKAKMRETGAAVGGEMSGHLFFADRYLGYDDALYAAVRLMESISSQEGCLSERLSDLPEVFSTPELRLFCSDESKFDVMARIAARQKALGVELSDIDGIRVRTAGGWWLLRVSNTQPALVARVEADSQEGLRKVCGEVAALLKAEGVTFPMEHVG